jgi:hypothetical protein
MLHEACQITKTEPTVLICIRGKTLPHNFRTIICDLELLSIPKPVNYSLCTIPSTEGVLQKLYDTVSIIMSSNKLADHIFN